uniref:Uncharacterized protein n=1 Tax=Anopheles merus TaxID=30066 RepID=A0A182V3A4_ANOME
MSPKRSCPPTCDGYKHGQTTGKYPRLAPTAQTQEKEDAFACSRIVRLIEGLIMIPTTVMMMMMMMMTGDAIHQQCSWWAVVLPNQCLAIFEFHHAPHPSTSNIVALIDAFQQTGPWIAICCDLVSPKI